MLVCCMLRQTYQAKPIEANMLRRTCRGEPVEAVRVVEAIEVLDFVEAWQPSDCWLDHDCIENYVSIFLNEEIWHAQ